MQDDASAVEIRPLEPARLADYLRFVDTRAFTDNPRWAGCYCFFPYNDHAASHWHQRTGDENRAAMSSCIATGQARGYRRIATARSSLRNAAPWTSYPMLDDEPSRTRRDRRDLLLLRRSIGQGIARVLLDGACDGQKSQGLAWAQARPRQLAASAAENHLGPLSMYLAAGFSILREDDEGDVYVQKRLA
jgi:hypothetical protein